MGSGVSSRLGLQDFGTILHNDCSDSDYNYSDSGYGCRILMEPDQIFAGYLLVR